MLPLYSVSYFTIENASARRDNMRVLGVSWSTLRLGNLREIVHIRSAFDSWWMCATPYAELIVGLAAVECRHKDDFVACLELICVLPLELPISVVNENQNSWSSVNPRRISGQQHPYIATYVYESGEL